MISSCSSICGSIVFFLENILEKTLANNPKSKTAKLCCAKVYLKNGNFKEAENLLMQILEEEPGHKKANQLLKELNEAYSEHINKESITRPAKPRKSCSPINTGKAFRMRSTSKLRY